MSSTSVKDLGRKPYAPALAGLLMLIVYVLSTPAGLTWAFGGADGGDLASAVYTLGLAHPPGYPTYLLAGQIARAIPVASPAYGLNLFSAIAAGAAVMLLAWAVGRHLAHEPFFQGRPWAASLIGALVGVVFGLAEVVWTQAIITEVYALAGLFCVAIFGLTLYTARSASQTEFSRRLAILAFVAALGAGSHYISTFMDLFAAVYLLLTSRHRILTLSNLGAVAAFAAGLLGFIYLPLRAGQVPASNWGNPDTFARFLSVVRAEAYSDRLAPGLMPDRLAALIRVLVGQSGIVGLALAAVGLSDYWDTNRKLLIAAVVAIALNLWFTTQYLSADTTAYIYPTLILLAVAMAAGFRSVLSYLSRASQLSAAARAAVVVVLCLGLVVPLAVRGGEIVSQANTEADSYGIAIMKEAPPRAVIVSDNDNQTFAIRYAALVSARRSDVVLVDERMWDSFDWFGSDLARFYPDLGLNMNDLEDRSISSFVLRLHTDRPVVFTYRPELPAFFRLTPLGDHLYLLEKAPAS